VITVLTLFTTQAACTDNGIKSQSARPSEKHTTVTSKKGSVVVYFCELKEENDTYYITHSFKTSTGKSFEADPRSLILQERVSNPLFGRYVNVPGTLDYDSYSDKEVQRETWKFTSNTELARNHIHINTFKRKEHVLIEETATTDYGIDPTTSERDRETWKCTQANYPFQSIPSLQKPYSESSPFRAFLEKQYDWGTGIKGKLVGLGKCTDIAEHALWNRRFTCDEGFAELTSPMGIKVCEVKKAEHRIQTLTLEGISQKGSTTRVSLGECRWKS